MLNALGCHIYAGGFSIGVRRAGFNLLGHLEEGSFGVETAKQNLKIKVWQGVETWDEAVGLHAGRVDWLYGNPPCSGWSSAGTRKGVKEYERYKTHAMTDCTVRLFSLIPRTKPRVFTWESVATAYTKGRDFVDERTEEVMSQGYHVYHLLLDGANCGLPQHRRRLFFIASKVMIDIPRPHEPLITVREALKDVKAIGPLMSCGDGFKKILELTPRTDGMIGLKDCFKKLYPNPGLNERGQVKNCPSFLQVRLALDLPACTMTGGASYFHPTEPRCISVLEQQLLSGYPMGYKFVGSLGQRYAQIGKAVLPPVAHWLGRLVKIGLIKDKKIRPGLTALNYLKKEAT